MGILGTSSKKTKQQAQTNDVTQEPQAESLEALVRRVVREEIEIALNPPKPAPPPKPDPVPWIPQPVLGVAFEEISPTERRIYSVRIENNALSIRELFEGRAIPVSRCVDAMKMCARNLPFGGRHTGREVNPSGKLKAVTLQKIAPELSQAPIVEIEDGALRVVETAEPSDLWGHAGTLARLAMKATLPPDVYALRMPLVA